MKLRPILEYLVMKFFSLLIALLISLKLLYMRIKKGSDYFTIKPRPHPPAILKNPRYGTHRYIHLPNQGVKLHYVEKGNKDKPLILCLHGFPDCWFSWKTVLQKFSEKYWVVAVDMRGYGDSDKPVGIENYATDLLVEDIRELLQILGKGKCILMAHDWGGVLGWLITSAYPDLFEKHISLNGPHLKAMENHRNTSWSQMKKSWYILFFQCPYLPELLLGADDMKIFDDMFIKSIKRPNNSLSHDEIEVYKYYFSKEYALTAPVNYYRNLHSRKNRDNSLICKVDSLIIWGIDDMALDKEIAEKTYDYCENLHVEYIENCGHFVLQENPEAVHQAMWNFLE